MTGHDKACIRVWDNGDGWSFKCGHTLAGVSPVALVCGREAHGFEAESVAGEAAKTHHWVAHVSCGVAV